VEVSGICLDGLGKQRKTSTGIVLFPIEIRTEYTSLQSGTVISNKEAVPLSTVLTIVTGCRINVGLVTRYDIYVSFWRM
jgi:hypothetical protein